jgi:hypothetical protein
MNDYLRRARAALDGFTAAVAAFEREATRAAASAAASKKHLDALLEIGSRLRTAVARLEHSLTQISGETALDVVDLQARMEEEGSGLASALKALEELIEKGPAARVIAAATLQTLEEGAERVAAAIFPNAIEGVREINSTLWDFRLIWKEYVGVLAREVARTGAKRLTTEQIAKVERTAASIRERFDAVNELLNELVVGTPGSGSEIQTLVRQARKALSDAIRNAKSKAADPFKPFHGVLNRAEKLARKIDGQFSALRIPVFPAAGRLDLLDTVVDGALYGELAAVERFALLNITARLKSIPLAPAGGNGDLLSRDFEIRVFDVFPDRVYFTAKAGFIAAVEALEQARVFEEAPASLHRFNVGSFKQRESRKGNLQLSYAFGSPERPDDQTKVRVDADIDLYRCAALHLFGEVLVNHLTGSKTDQFRVWDILAANGVAPLAGFDVVSV